MTTVDTKEIRDWLAGNLALIDDATETRLRALCDEVDRLRGEHTSLCDHLRDHQAVCVCGAASTPKRFRRRHARTCPASGPDAEHCGGPCDCGVRDPNEREDDR